MVKRRLNKQIFKPTLIIFGVFISILFSIPSWARIILVGPTENSCPGGCDMTSVALAVQLANSGDQINVYPGIFEEENLEFSDNSVFLFGQGKTPDEVVIKPKYPDVKGFVINKGGDIPFELPLTTKHYIRNITIDGFNVGMEITGKMPVIYPIGPLIEGCIFKNNKIAVSATQNTVSDIVGTTFIYNHIAIKSDVSSPIISGNIFIKNLNPEGGGGAIIIEDNDTRILGGPVVIDGNTFLENEVAIDIKGGSKGSVMSSNKVLSAFESSTSAGISINGQKWGNAHVIGNYVRFQNNSGIIFSDNQDSILFKSSITRNIVVGNIGNGIEVINSTPSVVNNTIADNDGDGLVINEGSPKDIYNNIISTNSGVGIRSSQYPRWKKPEVFYNNVWNNSGGNYVGIQPGPGSISEDPIFPGSQLYLYELGINSPCVDAGKITKEVGKDPDGTQPDMGAIFQDQRIDVYYKQAIAPKLVLSRDDIIYVGLFVINRSGSTITRTFGHFCFEGYGQDCQSQIFTPQPDIFDVTVGNQSHSFTIRRLTILGNAPYGRYILQTAVDWEPRWQEEFDFYVFPSLNSDDEDNEDIGLNPYIPESNNLSISDSSLGGCSMIDYSNTILENFSNLLFLLNLPILFILIRRKKLKKCGKII